jgi:hypothetical protein
MRSCEAAVFESREDVSRSSKIGQSAGTLFAISASSPERTNEVFSLTPVSFAALSIKDRQC